MHLRRLSSEELYIDILSHTFDQKELFELQKVTACCITARQGR